MTHRVLSYGGGVQSTFLLFAYEKGLFDRKPDYAVFADPRKEPRKVYEYMQWVLSLGLSIPIYTVSNGNVAESATTVKITKDGQRSYIKTALPVYTVEGLKKGIGQRHCTYDFKIAPVTRKVRQMMGRRGIRSDEGILAEMLIGISTDEAARAKPHGEPWIKNEWPLLEYGYSRQDCLDKMAEWGLPLPPRSACTMCPFHSDDEWLSLDADEFADAVQFEKDLQMAYLDASQLSSIPYLHASRVPIDQVEFKPKERRPDAFNNECEGFCGV